MNGQIIAFSLLDSDTADAAARAAIKAKKRTDDDLWMLRGVFDAACPSARAAFLELISGEKK